MDNSDITSLITSVLGNGELMEKLRSVSSSIKKDDDIRDDRNICDSAKKDECDCGCELPHHPPAPYCTEVCPPRDRCPTPKDRRRLIEALEPFLSPERCETAKKLLLLVELISSGNYPKGR